MDPPVDIRDPVLAAKILAHPFQVLAALHAAGRGWIPAGSIKQRPANIAVLASVGTDVQTGVATRERTGAL